MKQYIVIIPLFFCMQLTNVVASDLQDLVECGKTNKDARNLRSSLNNSLKKSAPRSATAILAALIEDTDTPCAKHTSPKPSDPRSIPIKSGDLFAAAIMAGAGYEKLRLSAPSSSTAERPAYWHAGGDPLTVSPHDSLSSSMSTSVSTLTSVTIVSKKVE